MSEFQTTTVKIDTDGTRILECRSERHPFRVEYAERKGPNGHICPVCIGALVRDSMEWVYDDTEILK